MSCTWNLPQFPPFETALEAANAKCRKEAALLQKIRDEIALVIVGQEILIERFLIALLCKGHVLIEAHSRPC